jgi:isocitrate dehydrogenase
MALRLAASRSSAATAGASSKRFFLDRSLTASISPYRCFFSTEEAKGLDDSVAIGDNIKAPPMVYIAGEEMTHYTSQLIVDKWIKPYFDTSGWEVYDLSCKARDESNDKVLHDAVEAGSRIGAIFKEPTITPSALQVEEMGLSKAFGSPNGAMRRGWNGITISRDTIHIEGMELGYKDQVFFERHAVGGEYGAGWNKVGKGTLLTTYLPDDGSPPFIVDKRNLTDDHK